MSTDLISISTIVVLLFAILDRVHSCALNCGAGSRCEMTMSTCEYPPCPYFPMCVPHKKHHHHHHRKHTDEVTTRRHATLFDSILPDPSKQVLLEEVEHPGQCPVITAAGPCLQTCRSDGDCPSDRKCCFNGCGNTCRSVTEDIPDKPGTCPRHIASMTTQCTDNCDSDIDCAGVQKCCKSRCGSHCTDPCYYWLRRTTRPRRKQLIWKLPFMCRS